jgi:hypothetical protein
MAHFHRKQTPPQFGQYPKYKPYLQADFLRCCAYCEMSEAYRNSTDAFGVDHFRPRSKFPKLECYYPNLYYCCNECNRYKGTTWPSTASARNGFADPCECDPFLDHLREEDDGRVAALNQQGEFMLQHLRLNRETCLRFRRRRARTRQRIAQYSEAIATLDAPSEILSLLRQVIDDIRAEWVEQYSIGGQR